MQVIDWQVIVKKHSPLVWQTAYRLLGNYADAEDCFQETFVCALQVSQRQQIRNFPALLARLATARAIDKLRQRNSRRQAYDHQADLSAMPSLNPAAVQQNQKLELAEQLRMALAQLPPKEAEVFCSRHLNNAGYRQIAKELGLKITTVGVLLHRAKARLRVLLDADDVKKET